MIHDVLADNLNRYFTILLLAFLYATLFFFIPCASMNDQAFTSCCVCHIFNKVKIFFSVCYLVVTKCLTLNHLSESGVSMNLRPNLCYLVLYDDVEQYKY